MSINVVPMTVGANQKPLSEAFIDHALHMFDKSWEGVDQASKKAYGYTYWRDAAQTRLSHMAAKVDWEDPETVQSLSVFLSKQSVGGGILIRMPESLLEEYDL